jgi:hypothetical protein
MPDKFFYFCALNSEDRRTWLEQILIDNQIYFRSRDQLNDPNELRPSVVFEGSDRRIRDFVRNLFLKYSPKRLSPANRLKEESRLIYHYRNNPEYVEGILHETLDRVGLFSLSETLDEPLLWAHYANGHRGVCIEFDANIGFFQAAQRVSYTNQAPVINRLQDGSSIILEKSMLTKGDAWTYEQEWRVIARWRDESRIQQYLDQHDVPDGFRAFMEVQDGPGYYSFPVESIRSIIFGSRIDSEIEVWIRKAIIW